MNLLRLPAKSLTETLRCMRVINLVLLSFTSKASKKAVESINLNIGDISVTLIANMLRIELKNTISWFQLHLMFENVETMPHSVTIKKGSPTLYRWNNIYNTNQITFKNSTIQFTARDYLCHLMDVLNRSSIEIQAYATVHSVSEKGVRALFRDIPIKKIGSISEESINNVLKFTYSQVNNLSISVKIRLPCVHDVFCSQFNYLNVFMLFQKLDDLLNLTSPLIDLDSGRLTESDMNLYIKHWMLGLAHQNLKRLRVSRGNFTRGVLKGITYQEQPTSISRSFGNREYCGGFDIQRYDRTDATLYIVETGRDVNFNFIVWE